MREKATIEVFTIDEFSEETQNKMYEITVNHILELHNAYVLQDKFPILDGLVVDAIKECEELRTPWFIQQSIWDKAHEIIKSMCEDEWYDKHGFSVSDQIEEFL